MNIAIGGAEIHAKAALHNESFAAFRGRSRLESPICSIVKTCGALFISKRMNVNVSK